MRFFASLRMTKTGLRHSHVSFAPSPIPSPQRGEGKGEGSVPQWRGNFPSLSYSMETPAEVVATTLAELRSAATFVLQNFIIDVIDGIMYNRFEAER